VYQGGKWVVAGLQGVYDWLGQQVLGACIRTPICAAPFLRLLERGNSGGGASTTTRLYRAVSDAEYKDIQNSNGLLRVTERSAEGKYFATSIDDAFQYGELLYKNQSFRVIAVDLSSEVVKQSDKMQMDWMTAIFIHVDKLINYTVVGEVTR
jgi:hypothetical protein